MRIVLRRNAESPDGTYGHLDGPGLSLTTCEEEDAGNRRGESRIPAGNYLCVRTIYYRHGYDTFEVTGVPERSRILFHPGNTEEDSQGCILVGMEFGMLDVIDEESGKRRMKLGVVRSREAFDVFMNQLRGEDSFQLEITDPEWEI